jgi:serine/threonine protein kinase
VTPHFETSCPHCRHNLRVRVEYLDHWVSCRYCDRTFLAGKATPPEEDLQAVRAERDRLRELIASLRGLLAEAEDARQVHRPALETGGGPADSQSVKVDRGNGFAGSELIDDGKGSGPGAPSIPGYEITDTLKAGAMSQVYRARQTSLDRIVALKVLNAALARSPEYRMRFLREARLSAQLSHPYLIATFDAGEVDGNPYFVMEYVEGMTIEEALARQQAFDEPMALRITLALAEALKYFHAHGLLHRDIKPANVILTREGGVKLVDLGLARSTDDPELAAVEEGKAIGTPSYISPEQVSGDVEPDIRSDLYSLGATLYRMVTGRVPFAGETSREVMRKHADRETPLVAPVEIDPELSNGLNALILKMLDRDRDHRFRNPTELIHALRGLLAEAAARASRSRLAGKPAIPG